MTCLKQGRKMSSIDSIHASTEYQVFLYASQMTSTEELRRPPLLLIYLWYGVEQSATMYHSATMSISWEYNSSYTDYKSKDIILKS